VSHDITREQSISILSSAFEPFQCVAKSEDRGNLVQFQVLGHGGEGLLSASELVRQQVTSSRRLEAIIMHVRSTLEQQGHTLAAWSFPNVG
jgi:hypothetical protein